MRVCVLSSAAETSPTPYLPTCDPDLARFLPEHEFTYRFIHKASAAAEVAALAAEGHDVFVNMCDGASDQAIAGIEVIEALEREGVAFTGADVAFYRKDRADLKRVCAALGVATPAYQFVRDRAGVREALERLRFPLIVKHHDSYCSVDMTPASRVETPDALLAEAGRMLARCGVILIEEYIAGEEYSALVLEDPEAPGRPRVPGAIRFQLPPGETILHSALKNERRCELRMVALADDALNARIAAISRALFVGLGGVSYGRCDLRQGPDGELYALEMNANSGIFYVPGAADYPSFVDAIVTQDPIGPAGFLDHLLRAALRRHAR